MLIEQMDEQARKDGIALRRIKQDPESWAALQRVVIKLRDDALATFGDEEHLNKDWWKGAKSVVNAILPAIEQRVQDVEDLISEERSAKDELRSQAVDGPGYGDIVA